VLSTVSGKIMEIKSECRFKRRAYSSMSVISYSKFRHNGTIGVDDAGLQLQGKRVYTLLVRLIIYAVSYIVPVLMIDSILAIVPLCISMYLMEEVILSNEELRLPWNQIKKYEVDGKRDLIALSIENKRSLSPIVFSSPKFKEITTVLRNKIGERERTSKGLKGVEQRHEEQLETMSKQADKILK
jgi:hypothetical protein